VDKIVVVSNEIRYRLINSIAIPNKKIIVISNSVDTDLFKPNKELRNKKREELHISDKEILIGTIGRLSAVKNYNTLVYAMSKVLEEVSNVKLIFVGNGPQYHELKKKIEGLNLSSKVFILGQRLDIVELLNAMDIFVLPSFFEGISISILEAMSVGLPVIASNVGGNPELIDDCETGFLFSPNNLDKLVQLSLQCINDPSLRNYLGINARRKALQNHSLEPMINTYAKLYIKCLKQKNKITTEGNNGHYWRHTWL